MNKYVVKATLQILTFIVLASLGSFAVATLLNYFQPDISTVIFIAMTLLLGYTAFNLIKIQASILESRDRLNKSK